METERNENFKYNPGKFGLNYVFILYIIFCIPYILHYHPSHYFINDVVTVGYLTRNFRNPTVEPLTRISCVFNCQTIDLE